MLNDLFKSLNEVFLGSTTLKEYARQMVIGRDLQPTQSPFINVSISSSERLDTYDTEAELFEVTFTCAAPKSLPGRVSDVLSLLRSTYHHIYLSGTDFRTIELRHTFTGTEQMEESYYTGEISFEWQIEHV